MQVSLAVHPACGNQPHELVGGAAHGTPPDPPDPAEPPAPPVEPGSSVRFLALHAWQASSSRAASTQWRITRRPQS